MKGTELPGGWLEFKGNEVNKLQTGHQSNYFYLNWGSELAWAKYNPELNEIQIKSSSFGSADGSNDDYSMNRWQIASPDFKSFLINRGRGISVYRPRNHPRPELEIIELNFDPGEEWMWVNKDFTKSIVPLTRKTSMSDNSQFGGTPLALFQIDLAKASYTTQVMDHFSDSYLGHNYILWRHYGISQHEDSLSKTTHYSATDIDMKEIDVPLVKLLNRYVDSLPDFLRRFYISSQGWAVMGVYSGKTETGIFLLNPEGKGQILPLFELGGIALPVDGLSRCAISEDGQYFTFISSFDRDNFTFAKGAVVHLGRVEKVASGFMAKITRIADFSDLSISPPIWIPGTHALALHTDPIDGPSRIRIYDLDKHPINWDKIPNATPVKEEVPMAHGK